MTYKGAYAGETSYSVGDIVVYQGAAYELFAAAAAGTTPHDTHKWQRIIQPMQDVVMMFHNMITTINTTVASQGTAESNLSKMIAPEYTKTTYAEHALVTKSGKLYYAKAAIEEAENWTAAHWQETTVGAEITALQGE